MSLKISYSTLLVAHLEQLNDAPHALIGKFLDPTGIILLVLQVLNRVEFSGKKIRQMFNRKTDNSYSIGCFYLENLMYFASGKLFMTYSEVLQVKLD